MKLLRRSLITLTLTVALLAALAFPERQRDVEAPETPVAEVADAAPFRWNDDELWSALEARFVAAASEDCAQSNSQARQSLRRVNQLLGALDGRRVRPDDRRWDEIESNYFAAGPLVAACPADQAEQFVSAFSRIRAVAKRSSIHWDMNSRVARTRLYRLLYGGRAAVEEVLLQMDPAAAAALALVWETGERSNSPSAEVRGVTVHSGDLLVSRGGYPTSALIARGSDYPGNFSHVALLHVNRRGYPTVIESHIDGGLTTTSVEKYFADKKLRVMLLRPRNNLPQFVQEPRAPHLAATRARALAVNSRVPYDFAMDYTTPDKMFCSEVASSAYRGLGVNLWMGISTISGPGLRRWLSGFGVEHFETQEPSDLEYDPQLVVVAEWRDPATLFKDHIDNAVTDAMLEGAEAGDEIEYSPLLLPFARLAKGYSFLLNKLERSGPVPEGMSAPAALRNRSYTRRHRELARVVKKSAEEFASANGYRAPYWQLVTFAREAVQAEGA